MCRVILQHATVRTYLRRGRLLDGKQHNQQTTDRHAILRRHRARITSQGHAYCEPVTRHAYPVISCTASEQAMLGIEAQLALQDAGAIALLRMGSFQAARCL